MLHIQRDPVTRRFFAPIEDEPGHPVIIADSPEQIEDFVNYFELGRFWREQGNVESMRPGVVATLA